MVGALMTAAMRGNPQWDLAIRFDITSLGGSTETSFFCRPSYFVNTHACLLHMYFRFSALMVFSTETLVLPPFAVGISDHSGVTSNPLRVKIGCVASISARSVS